MNRKRGQSILEYVIVLTAIVAAILFGVKYVKLSLIGTETGTTADDVTETSLFGTAGNMITDWTGELPGVEGAGSSPDG